MTAGSGPAEDGAAAESAAPLPYPGRRGADYDAAFAARAAAGANVHGEADLVSWLRSASVLDAGCGTGRVAIELHRRGVDVVGVDRDQGMLARARANAPDLVWLQADLASVAVPGERGRAPRRFDCVLLAGNVLLFVDPGTEARVVANLARHLRPGGRLVAGFQLRPDGLDCAGYDAGCAAAGLGLEARFATWARAPFVPGGGYAVSIHRPVG
ncbi:MAG TPA: class I SAM-dependent methyltransferase [Candidatus Micrarchaeia archaeon]|nr:class I SAM-dependent methyltransferase [Candidatus Micrarchaeia archaeon]